MNERNCNSLIDIYLLEFSSAKSELTLADWTPFRRLFPREGVPIFDPPFGGQPLTPHWTEHELVLDGEPLPPGWELVGGSWFIVCAENCLEKYEPLLKPFGELLPATYDDERVFVFNCTNLLDAIDIRRTKYELGYLDGPVNDFRSVAFDTQVVSSPMLFKSGNRIQRRQWISAINGENEFLTICESSKIPGISFEHVWQSVP